MKSGQVLAHFRTIAVRHFEAEVVVLDVGANAGMCFGHAAELGLPIAVEDHPVDVAAARVGFPADRFRRVEIDVHGGASRVVGIEHGLDRALADELAVDAGDDLAAGHVGEHLVLELRRIGAALADQVTVEPLLGDALELAEEMKLGVFAWVAPLVQDKVRCQLVQDLRRSHVAGMNEIEVDFFADDAGVLGLGSADEVGRQFQHGSSLNSAVSRSSGSSTR